MADQITAKTEPRVLVPENQYQAVCVDVIDLGLVENKQFGKVQHKGAIVWQLNATNPKTGRRYEVSRKFTISMHEKAELRKFLGQWRGKSYTDAEAQAGVPVDKLEGVNALITIEHTSKDGKTYANILSIGPIPKGLPTIAAEKYTRADFWKEDKNGAQKAATRDAGAPPPSDEDFPAALHDEEDDLPF